MIRQVLAGETSPGILMNDILSDDLTTSAEVLQSVGFRTAAFVANPWMVREFGFAQGFDIYDDSFASWDAPGTSVTRAALQWLKGVAPGEQVWPRMYWKVN